MEEKKEMQRPFIVEVDEVKSEMIQVINNAMQVRGLPCYIIDMVLSELVTQVKDGAKQELAMARAQMQQQEQISEEEVA